MRKHGGYSGFNDRYVDIRVEDHATPIVELGRLLTLHRKTFGVPPLPNEYSGFKMEPEPKDGVLETPRAAYETWVKRFRARDFVGLYAAQSNDFRKKNPQRHCNQMQPCCFKRSSAEGSYFKMQ